jgi:hypothetical protein
MRPLDPMAVGPQPGALADDEDLVKESLRHQPDGDPFEGVPNEKPRRSV